MRKLFNIGDRVKVYCSYGVMKATVIPPGEDDMPVLDTWHEPSLHVRFDKTFSVDRRSAYDKQAYVHPKQCRLLKRKTEKLLLSKDNLASAWNNTLAREGIMNMAADSPYFMGFCKALGFKEE